MRRDRGLECSVNISVSPQKQGAIFLLLLVCSFLISAAHLSSPRLSLLAFRSNYIFSYQVKESASIRHCGVP